MLSSLRIGALALALPLPALCTAEEAPVSAAADASPDASPDVSGDVSSDVRSNARTELRADAQPAVSQTPAAMVDVALEEPTRAVAPSVARVGLAELLDLVPEGDSSFVAIRDPQAAAEHVRGLVEGLDLDALALVEPESDRVKDGEAIQVFESVFSALGDPDLDLGRGVLILETSDGDAIVYASSSGNPMALREALQAAGATEANLPEVCVEPPKLRGYMACGASEPALLGLEAGDRGDALVASVGDALPRVDVEAHNIVAAHESPTYGAVSLAVEITPGELKGALGIGLGEATDAFAAGPAPSVDLMAPTGPLFWAQTGESILERFVADMTPETRALGESYSGEVMLSALPGGALGLLMGVKDPSPGAGAIAVAGFARDKIREELPGEPDVTMESIEASVSSFQAVRVHYEQGPWAETIARFGVAPTLWAFVAGKHAGLVLGGEPRTLAKVADGVGGFSGVSTRPAELMRDLRDGVCAAAFHVPIDSLQDPMERERILGLARQFRPLDPADVDALHARLDMLAPLSSMSMWLTDPATTPVIHVVVENFGDLTTEEGKDALGVLKRIRAGASPASEYQALASKYAASPRASRYGERAGATPHGRALALLTGFAFGLTAPVAPPPRKKRRSSAKPKPLGASRRRSVARRPIAEVKRNGIYTPNPDARKLDAARVGPATAGKGAVSFCVSSSGKSERVKTSKRFNGGKQPVIDRILRDTVRQWRFKPFIEGGRPKQVCSRVEFKVRFD